MHPYRRAGVVLLPLLVVMLAMGLRLAAWDWGLVTEAAMQKTGYPDSLLPADLSRPAGGQAGSYYGSYAYDEETFGAVIPTVFRLRAIREQCREEGFGWVACLPRLYAGAYADIDMAASPVAALYFSLSTLWVTEGIYGIQPTQREDLRTPLLRWGRWLALPWLALAAWVFLCYWHRLVRPSWHRLGLAGSAALGLYVFLLQPNLLTHGRLLTYNFMVMALELGLLALCLKWVAGERSIASQCKWAALTGILGGVGLATKMTIAPALAVTLGLALLMPLHLGYLSRHRSKQNIPDRSIVNALLPLFLFATLAMAIGYLLVYPALQAAEGAQTLLYAERTLLGREDLQAGTPWGRAFIYLTQTLPASMGWPLYLTGLGGIAWRLWNQGKQWFSHAYSQAQNRGKIDLLESMALAFLLLTMALYTTNPLGLAVQRTLTVIALFMLFAARGWSDAYQVVRSVPILRRALVVWAGFILIGMLYGAFTTTSLFAKDRPGYRNAMSAWMLKNLHVGDTLWLQGNDPHTLSDIAMVENLAGLSGQTHFHWEFRLPETFAQATSKADSNTSRPKLWGHYYAQCDCGKALAVFPSPAKTETPIQRWVRMAFGYHRWDQIMVQPDFAIYGKPGENLGDHTSTNQ